MTVVGLDGGLAQIAHLFGVHVLAVCHGELHYIAFLPSFWIERAGTEKHVEHVVDAVVVGALLPLVSAVVILAVLAYVALAVGIAVEHFVHRVAFALACSLAEVERCHVGGGVAKQRVAKHEEVVHLAVAAGGQTGAVGRLAAIAAGDGIHGGGARFHPHKLPVVVEVVGEKLVAAKGGIAECALGCCRECAQQDDGQQD